MKLIKLLDLRKQTDQDKAVLELLAQTAQLAPELYEALTKHDQIPTDVLINMFDELAKEGPLNALCRSWIIMIIKALPYVDLIEQINTVSYVHYRDGRSLDVLFKALGEVVSDQRVTIEDRFKATKCYFAALYNQFDTDYVTRPARRSELMINWLSKVDGPEIGLDLLAIKEFEGDPELGYFLPSAIVWPVIDWLFKEKFPLSLQEIFELARQSTPSVRKYVLAWLWVNNPHLTEVIEPELMPIADINTLPTLFALDREDLVNQIERTPPGIKSGLKILQMVAQDRTSNPEFGLLLSKISRQQLWLDGTLMRKLQTLNIEVLLGEHNAETVDEVSGLADSQMAVFLQFICFLYSGFKIREEDRLRWDAIMKVFKYIYPQCTNLQTVEFFRQFSEYFIPNHGWQDSGAGEIASLRESVFPHLEDLGIMGSELMRYFPLLPMSFWGKLNLLLQSNAFREQFRENYIQELVDLLKSAPRKQTMDWLSKLRSFLKKRLTRKDASRIARPSFFAGVSQTDRFNLVKEYTQVLLAFSNLDEPVEMWREMVDVLAKIEPQRFQAGDPNHTVNWAQTLNTNHLWWRKASVLIQDLLEEAPGFLRSIADLKRFDKNSELIDAYELLTYSDDVKSVFFQLFHKSNANVSTMMHYLKELIAEKEMFSLPNGEQIIALDMFAEPHREVLLEMASVFGVITPRIAKLLCGMNPAERQQLLQAIPQLRHELHANQVLNLRKVLPQIKVDGEELQQFEAELIVAFVNPGTVTLDEIEVGLDELKSRRKSLVQQVEKAGLPEYNKVKEVTINLSSKVYTITDELKEVLRQTATALPQLAEMNDTDRNANMGQMFAALTNFDAANTPVLAYLPYILDGLEGKADRYGLMSLLQTIKAFEAGGKSPASGNELMTRMNRVRKLVNFTGREVFAGIDLLDKLAGQFMNVLKLDAKAANERALALLENLEPTLANLAKLLLKIYRGLQLTQRTNEEEPQEIRVLKLRAVISKSLASFFAKGAVDICTAEDRDLFLRADHFHLNLIDEETGVVMGNIQLYVLPDRQKRYLLVRGINFRDGVYSDQEVQALTDFALRTCMEIFEASTGFDELVFTEGLEGWDPDSNNPVVQEHLRDTIYPYAEIIDLEKEFDIYSEMTISRVYKITKSLLRM